MENAWLVARKGHRGSVQTVYRYYSRLTTQLVARWSTSHIGSRNQQRRAHRSSHRPQQVEHKAWLCRTPQSRHHCPILSTDSQAGRWLLLFFFGQLQDALLVCSRQPRPFYLHLAHELQSSVGGAPRLVRQSHHGSHVVQDTAAWPVGLLHGRHGYLRRVRLQGSG